MEYTLENIDPDDIGELLLEIESSLNIRYNEGEIYLGMTFGEFCDKTICKIPLKHQDNCTSQQGFYKIRKVIAEELNISLNQITPDTYLDDLLPRRQRRQFVKKIEKKLDFKLFVLGISISLSLFFGLILIFSLFVLFFKPFIGLIGMITTIIGRVLGHYFANTLQCKTIRELIDKQLRRNYLKLRRNPDTFNPKELENLIVQWFSDSFALDESQLTREAKF